MFKATCMVLLKEAGKPIRVTRFGTLMADIALPGARQSQMRPDRWLGIMKDRITIIGNLVTPSGEFEPWEVERSHSLDD